MLEQSSEPFLDREGKTANDSDLGLTPVRVVPLTPGRIHTEVKDPTLRWLCLTSQVLQGCECVYSSAFRL